MNKTGPIKDLKELERWKEHVKSNYTPQHYVFLILSLNTTVKTYKMVALKWSDIEKPDCKGFQDFIILIEPANRRNKSDKVKKIKLNTQCLQVLTELRVKYPDDIWVFQSRSFSNLGGHWNRSVIYKFYVESARAVGITSPVGADTPRITLGWHAFRQGVNLVRLREIYGYNTLDDLKDYLCITPEEARLFPPEEDIPVTL